MYLKVLGAHNREDINARMESHLIDGVLALDAGSLTRGLTFDEQNNIKAILISHRHFDHIRDLLPLGLNIQNRKSPVEIYAIQDTVDFLLEKLLDGSLYPNFVSPPPSQLPTFHLNVVEFYRPFRVLNYSALAVPVPHAIPAAGFQIGSSEVSLFYTGDTGKEISKVWRHLLPDVILTEVTYGNKERKAADRQGHLTPEMLGEALSAFKIEHGYLPRVIVSHMSPPWEDKIRSELAILSRQLGVQFEVSHAGMTVTF